MGRALLALLSIFFLAAAARADSPESPKPTPCDLSKRGFNLSHVRFDTSSLLCSDVWPAKEGVLLFNRSTDFKTWSFILALSGNSSTYIAIGFSKDGQMVGSSAVAGWLASGGKGKVKKYYLGSKSDPSLIEVDKGGLDLKSGATIFSQSGRLFLAFQLDTSNEQPNSKLLYAIGAAPTSGDQLNYHFANRISTTITFVPGGTATTPTSAPAPVGKPAVGPSGATNATKGGNSSAGRIVLTSIPAIFTLLAAVFLQ